MAGKKTETKKGKEPKQKIARREVNNCRISDGEILSALAFNLTLPNINAGGADMLSEVISHMQPSVNLREVIEPHFAKLTSNLSEFRTRHAVQDLEIEVSHYGEYDESGLQFRLFARTDSKAIPDRPAMTGQQAKQILENCFGEFHIDVQMDGAVPIFSQKTSLGYTVKNPAALSPQTNAIPEALPTTDPAQLYINVVHNICGVIQENEKHIEVIHARVDYDEKNATVEEFKAHVRFRNGPEEPVVKKKKVTRKK
uniref:Uncharacterized protein n=1 Tax=Pseudomonas phage HRDY3 TaxID=3236930 RepID=A0AB39CD65_9VIRU